MIIIIVVTIKIYHCYLVNLMSAGESYAGVYIPMLASAILDGNTAGTTPKINIRGNS